MSLTTSRWVSSAVLYEVFVRNHGSEGGFQAVTRDLERICSLGVDVVWLMPIYPIGELGRNGSAGSPYAIRDFRGFNPELGTPEDFQALVDRCHELGMKIILDVVFNHTSPDSVLAKTHPEWFLRNDQGHPIPKFPEWADIVDLRYLAPDGTPHSDLWEIQIETLGHWIDQGVDGFRCDVASVVPPAFWASAQARLSERTGGKEILWVAETVHKHFLKFMRDRGFPAWSDGEVLKVFDLSYDHDGAEYLDEYFAGKGSLRRYLDHLFVQETMNPVGSLKLRFVENHDLPRAAAKIRGAERLRSWTAFQALLPGAFLVYAGQEYAMTERPDLFDKCPISLHDGPGPGHRDFSLFLQRLLAEARKVKTSCSFFSAREATQGVVVLEWGSLPEGGATATRFRAVLNLEDRFGTFDPGFTFKGTNLIGDTPVDLAPGCRLPTEPILVQLPPEVS